MEQILVPCGHTLAVVCPACAERARTLRAAQCREGWHLESEPVMEPDRATEDQQWWIEKRAEAQAMRDQADHDGQGTSDLDELTTELDSEITDAGMRGNVLPARPVRRHRTTRRRQDAAPLPRRKIAARTVGNTYTTPDGKQFRPSLFVTLTCPATGESMTTASRPIRTATTTPGRHGTPCTSRPCSTGSSRTCAASSATACNTSPSLAEACGQRPGVPGRRAHRGDGAVERNCRKPLVPHRVFQRGVEDAPTCNGRGGRRVRRWVPSQR